MSKYGMPYMGSKASIADDLVAFLPADKRFVDLFGGGGAMTHCALLSRKWQSVLYNEYDPMVVELFRKATNGDYSYDRFKPEFITREMFLEKKDTDPYVKYIWSFGNRGDTYLFGKDIEKAKETLHNAVVFDCITDDFIKLIPNFNGWYNDSIHARRLQLKRYLKELKQRCDIQQLEQLERLQQLEQLERLEQRLERLQRQEQLERLQRLEIKCGTYTDYEYQDGDVVYCDPPYENTAKYNETDFNHKGFYDWAASRPYQVFFSSYEISDDRFYKVWTRYRRCLLSQKATDSVEILYSNKPVQEEPKQIIMEL